jgi:ATP-binding cassette, subfamily B, bacterial HlyB/CyaB
MSWAGGDDPLSQQDPTNPSEPEAVWSFAAANGAPFVEPEILSPPNNPGDGDSEYHPRVRAMLQAARYHGVELDPNECRSGIDAPSAAMLSQWAQYSGMWARALRITWRHLMQLQNAHHVVLLFSDGGAAILVGANRAQQIVFIKDPCTSAAASPVAVDELRLSSRWAGEAVFIRPNRGFVEAEAPFNLRWLTQLVLQERRALIDIGVASLTISILTIVPPLIVMTTVNKVLQFQSVSTLVLLSGILLTCFVYDTMLGFARRAIVAVVGARLDTKLNLHVFNRLLRLPLDYFERHPAGETMYRIGQIYQVREFMTGKLLSTFLDLITLCILLPFLFYLTLPRRLGMRQRSAKRSLASRR